MISNPFTNPNKVCNPSDSSERRKNAIRLKYGKLIYEGCSESYGPGVISLLPAMQHG